MSSWRLGSSLNKYQKQHKNKKMERLTLEVQFLYQEMYVEFLRLRKLQDRSKLIRLFYEKKMSAADRSGLSEAEFLDFRKQLDEGSGDSPHRELLNEFDRIDLNDDKIIDLEEFEAAVMAGYRRIMQQVKDKYNVSRKPLALEIEKERSERGRSNLLRVFERNYSNR